MIIISHRGNTNGPNHCSENDPSNVIRLLYAGFDVEIDVWFVNNKWYLGHDKPNFNVNVDFITQQGLWLHAKNIDAMCALKLYDVNYFYHNNDDCVLTSNNYIWTHNKVDISCISDCYLNNIILVLPEIVRIDKSVLKKCHAICTDYVDEYNLLNKKND